MGFDDREIVALSGAHTIGRAFAERSGTVSEGYGPKKGSVYTKPTHVARGDGKKGIGMAGGRSWTKQWLTFDNSCAPRTPAPPSRFTPPSLPGSARQLPPSAEIHRALFLGRYFTDMEDVSFEDDGGDTLTLPTDKSLTEDAEFKKTFDEFQDQVRNETSPNTADQFCAGFFQLLKDRGKMRASAALLCSEPGLCGVPGQVLRGLRLGARQAL